MIYTDDKLKCAGDSLMTPCRAGKFVQVLAAGLVLLIEGGQWFWPPVRVGFVRNLPGTPYQLPGRREYIAYSAGNLLSAVAAFFFRLFPVDFEVFFFSPKRSDRLHASTRDFWLGLDLACLQFLHNYILEPFGVYGVCNIM